MINISSNNKEILLDKEKYSAFKVIKDMNSYRFIYRFLYIILAILLITLFLPWTQNVSSEGKVTAINPAQRPQKIQTAISGQIQKWYVREGDFVKKGDTILFISEVKEKYLDPQLLAKTKQQIDAKVQSAKSYGDKANALDAQSDAILKVREMKLVAAKNYIQQAKLKIQADSIDYQAAITNLQIADKQFVRMQELYNKGLKSLTSFEEKKQKYQEATAKKISQESKLLSSKTQLANAYNDLMTIQNEYKEKFDKAQSDKFGTMSSFYDTDASLAKMQNEYANLNIRNGMYYVVAPQDGYVTKITKAGLGEIIKENEEMLTIMPAKYDLAVELYVQPMDLPLIKKSGKVQLFFDGWPSIVFSGWEGASYGTFSGNVIAIDQYISENGKYRIMVAPNEKHHKWPEALRIGSGAQAFMMLNDVPIWYELWRKLNGFPPKYYTGEEKEKEEKKK